MMEIIHHFCIDDADLQLLMALNDLRDAFSRWRNIFPFMNLKKVSDANGYFRTAIFCENFDFITNNLKYTFRSNISFKKSLKSV